MTQDSEISATSKHQFPDGHYLNSLGVSDNVEFFPDPAFFVAPELVKQSVETGSRPKIAINLSPLSTRYCNLTLEQAAIQQANAIDNLIRHFDADIVLIPHVIDEVDENDDDLRYLKAIYRLITNKNRVTFVDTDPGFIGIRKVLIDCDLLLAARMHCAINGLCGHVPSVFLSYSQKSQGMCNVIFNTNDYVVNLHEFNTPNFLNKVDYILNNVKTITKYVTNRISQLKRSRFQTQLQHHLTY